MNTIETSPEIKDIASALLTFQAGVGGVHKDARNPAFKSRYATLENVIDTVRPGLQAAGIVFLQAPGMIVDGKMCLTTRLIHSASGQWIQSTMQAPLPKNDPQAVGSATTYLSRYSLMAILGVPPTDDDAEAAMPRGNGQPGRDPEPDHGKADFLAAAKRTIATTNDGRKLQDWWMSVEQKQARRDFGLSQAEIDALKDAVTARLQFIGRGSDGDDSRRAA